MLCHQRASFCLGPRAVYIVSKMANDAFRALAHPLRRDIVERLSGGVATVGEVTRDFGVSKPTISRHLKLLEDAGVVSEYLEERKERGVSERSGQVVRIERTFAASAEDVFDAWTSPEVMRRWFHCAPDWETPVAEVDLRVGGVVRVVMRRPDGTEAGAQGQYTLVDRPHRLMMNWTFDDDPSNEQLIELSFSESEGLT